MKLTDAIAEPDDSTNLFPNGEVSVVESPIQCGNLHSRVRVPDPVLSLLDCFATLLGGRLDAAHGKPRRVKGHSLLPGLIFT